MDEALIQVGLPVKCRTCGKKGYVKPHTDYNGWYRWKLLREVSRWYCPDDAPKGVAMKQNMDDGYPTPELETAPEDIEAELYKLLD